MTGQARAWLAEYFAVRQGRPHDLPEELARWLGQHTRRAADGVVSPPVPPLEVTRDDGCLRVRLLTCAAAEQHVLLLEEEHLVDVATALKSLGLTKREAEVLSWVAQGKTNAETAVLCNISMRTVHKHLEHIYQKLGVESRTAAARRALEALNG